MSDTNRYITRRPALPAPRTNMEGGVGPARVEVLRRLVAAGQYQVSPRWLATKIFRAAGVPLPQ